MKKCGNIPEKNIPERIEVIVLGKGGYWVSAIIEDIEITYSFDPHTPIKLKGTPWLYCKYHNQYA